MPSPYSSTTAIMTLLNGLSLDLPVEHNHLMDLSAKDKLSISSVPTSFTLLILSSTICHSNAGISTSLRIGHSFCHVSRSHLGTEFTPCREILARVLSPINLRYLSSCSPRTQCGCCHQTLCSGILTNTLRFSSQVCSSQHLPIPAAPWGVVVCFSSLQAQHLSS